LPQHRLYLIPLPQGAGCTSGDRGGRCRRGERVFIGVAGEQVRFVRIGWAGIGPDDGVDDGERGAEADVRRIAGFRRSPVTAAMALEERSWNWSRRAWAC
jgi:hypothetical protein